MKRPELVKKLMNEGLSGKLLSNLTDKQLKDLSERVLSEETLNIPKDDNVSIEQAKKSGDKFVTYEEESEESSTVNLDELVKKIALSGKYSDIVDEMTPDDYSDEFEFGDNFISKLLDDYVDHKQYDDLYTLFKDEYGDIILDMFRSGRGSNIQEWVEGIVKDNYHTEVTTKKEMYEMIGALSDSADALGDANRMFDVDEQSPQPSEPDTDTPVREKPTTKPGKPKRENPFEPKHKPKPKAVLPKQLSFSSLGIELKQAAE